MNRKHALLGMVACAMLFLSLQASGPAEPAAPGTGYTMPVASTTGIAEDFKSYAEDHRVRDETNPMGGTWNAWTVNAGNDFTKVTVSGKSWVYLLDVLSGAANSDVTAILTFPSTHAFAAATDWIDITVKPVSGNNTAIPRISIGNGQEVIRYGCSYTQVFDTDKATVRTLKTITLGNEYRIRIAWSDNTHHVITVWENGTQVASETYENYGGRAWNFGATATLTIFSGQVAVNAAYFTGIRCSWLIEEAGPILIDGDADYPSYASSGSGTSGDPWVVDDHEIHCNDTCVAVEVSSASEHATFSNITTNGTDTFNAIEITSTGNVTMTGITISNASTGINITGCDGITIDGATIDTGSTAVAVTASTGIVLDGVFIDGGDVEFENVNDSVIRDCAFSGSLFINNSRNVTVENCTFSGLFMFAIYLDGTIDCITIVDCGFAGNFVGVSIPAGGNVTIQDCLFWMNMGGVAIDTGGNATVENCTFTANWYGVLVNTGGLGTITGCTFTANDVVLDSASTSIRVSGNFIMPGNTVLLDGNATWAGNYYRDYFDLFPGAITVNTTTNVLASEYPLNPTTNDTMPLYYPAWFPRSERFAFRFYSNVDYEGVPFEQLQLFIDGVRVTTATPLAGDLLSRVTVYDYSGRLLHDEVYNLNASGPNINIGLDVSVYVHFQFYSTLDYFGLPFELVKLYVNGTRITTPSPTMRPAVINIVVRDYADIVIYNQTIDLATTGIYIHIGLPVALTTITNQHDQEVIFMLARGTVTTTFAMARGGQLTLWLATGDYSYQVAATDGTVLEEFHEHAINANVTTRTIVLAIGCGGVPPPVLPLPSLLSYCVLLAGCGALNGIVLLLAINMRRRRTP